MECCALEADKFHANCYSYSEVVLSMHYLLRKKPYRIMWGGNDIYSEYGREDFTSKEDMLGISTFLDKDDFEMRTDVQEKSYYKKVLRFLTKNNERWKRMNVWKEALEFFDWDNTHSVDYRGFLVNHTKNERLTLRIISRSLYPEAMMASILQSILSLCLQKRAAGLVWHCLTACQIIQRSGSLADGAETCLRS